MMADTLKWEDIKDNFINWYAIYMNMLEWETVRNSIPPYTDLIRHLPHYSRSSRFYKDLFSVENSEFNALNAKLIGIKNDTFVKTASNEQITRLETFLGIKGLGTLEQRKTYLLTLSQRGAKLNEGVIKEVANTITGSDCIVTFFGADETNNPEQGYGLLRVQVLSPDSQKDYRYNDIFRVLKPLAPAHIKLVVLKYFGTWGNIKDNFSDWNNVSSSMLNWNEVRSYIPPWGD